MRSQQLFHLFAVGLVVAMGAAGHLQTVHAEGENAHTEAGITANSFDSTTGAVDPCASEAIIASPDSTPFGLSYGEWAARLGPWLYSLPVDRHPLFDTADCSEGQSGNVWFLGGTFAVVPVDPSDPSVVIGIAERHCTVLEGTALFFPVISADCNTAETAGLTDEELLACAVDTADHITAAQAEINGVPVQNLDQFRVQSPPHEIGPFPANNVLGAPEGTVERSVADGFYLFLNPLPVGEHTIHFGGVAEFTLAEDGFDFRFELDITYHISVVPPIQRFEAICTPEQEVADPPVVSPARSIANLTVLNFPTGAMLISSRVDRRLTTPYRASHIHLAPPGVNGPIVVPFDPPIVEIEFLGYAVSADVHTSADLTGPLAGMTLHDLVREIQAGNTYVNVHTNMFPGGETRGLIEENPDTTAH